MIGITDPPGDVLQHDAGPQVPGQHMVSLRVYHHARAMFRAIRQHGQHPARGALGNDFIVSADLDQHRAAQSVSRCLPSGATSFNRTIFSYGCSEPAS